MNGGVLYKVVLGALLREFSKVGLLKIVPAELKKFLEQAHIATES
jgi:hypothetical protein